MGSPSCANFWTCLMFGPAHEKGQWTVANKMSWCLWLLSLCWYSSKKRPSLWCARLRRYSESSFVSSLGCPYLIALQSWTAKACMFYISWTCHWIFFILTASSLDWNFQLILQFFGIFRWKFRDCQILGQNFSYYRLHAPLICPCFCNFDCSSNAFMAFLDMAWWPFCFFTTHTAASPVSPFL